MFLNFAYPILGIPNSALIMEEGMRQCDGFQPGQTVAWIGPLERPRDPVTVWTLTCIDPPRSQEFNFPVAKLENSIGKTECDVHSAS